MSSGRSIPTVDRISDLHDSILCHILSFLPTKFSATTSILSKRWKPLWLSVLGLNFDDKAFNDFNTFREFVYSTMFSLRDKTTSIKSFTLKLGHTSRFHQREFDKIFKCVAQRGVENLNFNMPDRLRCIKLSKLPPHILRCKRLQVLRLENIKIWDFDQIDFPCLKTLHLDRVYFISLKCVVKFLYGCTILEDFNTKSCYYHWKEKTYPMEDFNALPNLVKVRIFSNMDILKTLACETSFLHAEQIWGMTWKKLPMFHNLTHMELTFGLLSWDRECGSLIKIFSHFPNLQHFNLLLMFPNFPGTIYSCSECFNVPSNSTVAPECLSSQLKTFSITGYTGRECEFKFVKYVMQHSKVLETMTIKSTCLKKKQMFMKLSSCRRGSTTCKLLVG